MLAQDMPLEAVLDGMQERKIAQLKKKGFETVGDLLRYCPKRYEDRGNYLTDFSNMATHVNEKIAVEGTIKGVYPNYGKDFLRVILEDTNGLQISIMWFHQTYLAKRLYTDKRYVFYGKLTYSDQYKYTISSPSYFSPSSAAERTPLPVYGKVPGMSTDYLIGCIKKAIDFIHLTKCEDPIPGSIRDELGLDDWEVHIKKVHQPKTMQDVADAQKRQTAELLLPFCMALVERKYAAKAETDKTVDALAAKQALRLFAANLPFPLTEDQSNALQQMSETIASGKRLDALVQGDVGCGKTAIAEGITAVMLAGGYQTVIMAPTTVLAEQHYIEFAARFPSRVTVFLGSNMKAKEKRERLAKIKSGEAHIIVGTHAVIGKDVEYHNLGLTITDEEHRFGVNQRNALRTKAAEGAHSISMSATPIPRSIALALYGDATTIYNIHTMPAGRKPVQTIVYSAEEKTYEAIYRQIKAGRQAYVICPLISNSDVLENVDSLEETELKMTRHFAQHPEVILKSISSEMKKEDVNEILDDFKNGKVHILLSTTIVEVGVNVPNATVMLIKNAERFGLAQLHQLRGRVGRSSLQSYCVLLSDEKTNPRLQAMARTNDGFEIAKIDLEQRGMGNLVGTEQSGFDTAVNAMVIYKEMYEQVNSTLENIMRGKLLYEQTVRMANALKN